MKIFHFKNDLYHQQVEEQNLIFTEVRFNVETGHFSMGHYVCA